MLSALTSIINININLRNELGTRFNLPYPRQANLLIN